ncbi:MAG: DUF1799 domain-containing protein [Paracoccaceae bacterium]
MGIDLTVEDLGIEDDDHEGIWPDHVSVVEAFLSVATQWRMVGLADGRSMATGLDYGGVKAGLELAEIEVTPAFWADLQLIELGARRAMNERT